MKIAQGGIGSAQIQFVKSLPKKSQRKKQEINLPSEGHFVIGKHIVEERDWRVIGVFTNLEEAKKYVNKHRDCFVIEQNFILNKIMPKKCYHIWPE